MFVEKPKVRFVLSLLLVSAIFLFLGFSIFNSWSELSNLDWSKLWLASIFYLACMLIIQLLLFLGWYLLLRSHEVALAAKSVFISFFVPVLGKYVPGKVLFALGRVELCHRVGGNRGVGLNCFVLETAYLTLAALVLGIPATLMFADLSQLQQTTLILVGAVVFLVLVLRPNLTISMINRLLRRLGKETVAGEITIAASAALFLFYVGMWLLYGVAGLLLLVPLVDLEVPQLLLVVSAFVASWAAGFISVITPGGIGVREGVFVILLSSFLTVHEAALVAILARVLWTIAELGCASLAVFLQLDLHGADKQIPKRDERT